MVPSQLPSVQTSIRWKIWVLSESEWEMYCHSFTDFVLLFLFTVTGEANDHHTDIHTSVHLCLISAQLTESCCFLLWTGEEMKCPENNKVHTDRLGIEPDIYLPGTDHFTMWPGNVSLNSWDKLLMTKKSYTVLECTIFSESPVWPLTHVSLFYLARGSRPWLCQK